MKSQSIIVAAAKRALLGPVNYMQKINLACEDPQPHVDVWLHGAGAPLLVNQCHLMACAAPLTIGVALDEDRCVYAAAESDLTLEFRTHKDQRLLGEIGLSFVSSLRAGSQGLCLFHVKSYRNLCLSPLHLWAHHQQYARTYQPERNQDVPITLREARAMIVFYLCPRPITLVTVVEDSAAEGKRGNIFPMNLMGHLGNDLFAFALNSHRSAAPLVDRARRVVLSSVSLEHADIVTRLGANHRKSFIDWDDLPFATIRVDSIDAPVPSFALHVRELHVEAAHPLGSHTLFIAKITAEHRLAEGPHFFTAHGLYNSWQHQPALVPAQTHMHEAGNALS